MCDNNNIVVLFGVKGVNMHVLEGCTRGKEKREREVKFSIIQYYQHYLCKALQLPTYNFLSK